MYKRQEVERAKFAESRARAEVETARVSELNAQLRLHKARSQQGSTASAGRLAQRLQDVDDMLSAMPQQQVAQPVFRGGSSGDWPPDSRLVLRGGSSGARGSRDNVAVVPQDVLADLQLAAARYPAAQEDDVISLNMEDALPDEVSREEQRSAENAARL